MAQSYSNYLGSGDRRIAIGVSATLFPTVSGTYNSIVDNSTNGLTLAGSLAVTGKYIEFWMIGGPRIITEMTVTKEATTDTITFKVQGSDGSGTWTDLSSAVYDNSTSWVIALTNSTAYQTYRIIGVSGTQGGSAKVWREVTFKIDDDTTAQWVDVAAGNKFSTAASGTVAITPTAANEIIVVAVHAEQTTVGSPWSVTGITDTQGLTWAKIADHNMTDGGSRYSTAELWWALAPTAAAHTITVTLNASIDDATLHAVALRGVPSLTSPFVSDASLPGKYAHGASSSNTPTVTISTPDKALVLAFVASSANSAQPNAPEHFSTVSDQQNSGGSKWSFSRLYAGAIPGALASAAITTSTAGGNANMMLVHAVSFSTTPAELDLAVTFNDESTFDAPLTYGFELAASFLDESVFNAALASSIPTQLLAVSFTDESVFNAVMTAALELSVSFAEQSTFNAKMTVLPTVNLAVSFADESQFNAAPSLIRSEGKHFFAWVDGSTPFDPSQFLREDERVYSWTMSQAEGDFASLSLVIRNPRIGLLNPARHQWIWFSRMVDGIPRPVFYGRIVGIPSNVFAEYVTVDFIGRPIDYADQKYALAQTLKVLPYWDPVFIATDKLDDPDVVLEARSELWHINPVTHEVTTSNVLIGELGVIEFTESDYYEESLAVSLGSPPARSVQMTATVPWKNTGTGNVDLTDTIINNWPVSPYYQMIGTYSFQGLVSDWPKAGASIGEGWKIVYSELHDEGGMSAWIPGQQWLPNWVDPGSVFGGPDGTFFVKNWPADYAATLANTTAIHFIDIYAKADILLIPMGWGVPNMIIGYDVSRDYSETVTMTMNTETQDILTMPGDDDHIILNISGNDVSTNVGGEIPIGDPRRVTYFDSPRGGKSLEHLLATMRANLLIKSRCVSVTFSTKFDLGFPITLKHNVLLHYAKLPGGQALGKVTNYSHSMDGSTGKLISTITFECAVGRGGSYTADAGTPIYVVDDYVAADYQQHVDQVHVLPEGDLAYTVVPYEPNDDGFRMMRQIDPKDIITYFNVTNPPYQQYAAIVALEVKFDSASISSTLDNLPTTAEMHIKSAEGGPFSTNVEVDVSDLVIPKQIDLEAASV